MLVYVKIAHFSVKEFLLSKVIQLGPTKSIRCTESISQQAISKTCLAYLLQFRELDSITNDNIESFPLAIYAAEWCVSHIESIRGEDMDATLEQMILQLAAPSSSYILINWRRLQHTTRGYRMLKRPTELVNCAASHLCLAISIGLMLLVDHLIKDGIWDILLQTASNDGHLEVAHMLSEKGTHDNAVGRHSATALHAVSYLGRFEIVKLLLERGADVNGTGGPFGTALQAASYKGHLEIAKLLLDRGADINITGGPYGTALQAAIYWNRLEIARLLLERGADVNGTGGAFGTALQAASYGGRLEISQLLLERGADINATGGPYGTALQAALYWNRLEIFQLLLDKGADVNAIGGQHGTMLQAACYRGSFEIARLLLEKGAKVNATGGQYGTALQAAAYIGRLEIAELLLERGADVNATGGVYGSALNAVRAVVPSWMWKREANMEAIAELLKEHGALEMDQYAPPFVKGMHILTMLENYIPRLLSMASLTCVHRLEGATARAEWIYNSTQWVITEPLCLGSLAELDVIHVCQRSDL
ncbi:hypothetical protein HWV62_16754 [Athelia sp. TMB]|nr:hypothetical protein HWV62_16754 [Athelia sp. TMB]